MPKGERLRTVHTKFGANPAKKPVNCRIDNILFMRYNIVCFRTIIGGNCGPAAEKGEDLNAERLRGVD